MASGLLIKQKQLLAGDGITIEHAQTSSTISLSNSTLNAAVRIYDATIASDTGVVTITDGTPVADLNIGDEIRTPDGVYQKVKDGITTTGPADGTRIEVSGITSPSDANGYYALQSEDVWKHETANYWITLFFSSGWYWMLSNKSDAANPGECLFYGVFGKEGLKPWEIDTNWQPMNGAVGNPQLENVEASTTITNTIDLFEYASTSVASADIVQSVNGNKPDASGNVTIDTGSGGLTSVSVGNGLTGNGTASNPITLDLSNYIAESDIHLRSSGPYSVELLKGAYGITINSDGNIKLESTNTTIVLGIDITYNNNSQNTAGGFAIVGSDGKLPSSILPDSSIDLSNYSTTSNISLKTTGSSTGVTLGSTNGTVSIYSGYDGNGLSIGSTSCSYSGGNVSLSGRLSTSVGSYGAGTTTINATSLTNLKLRIGSSGTASSANTANGLVVVGSDGKIPSSVLPESTVDLSNYSAATIKLSSTSTFTASGAMTTNIGSTTGVTNITGNTVRLHGTYGTTVGEAGELNLGGSSANSLQPATQITVNVTDPANKLLLNNAKPNAANGFALVGSDGKLPSSIIPVSSNRHPFTSSDLSSNVLTITTTGNVTGVIDDSGKAWNFADEEVTYTDSTVSVDLSGVFAKKGIATPTGTWKLMLYGA